MSNTELFSQEISQIRQGNPEYLMKELHSRIKQLHNQQDKAENKSFTGDDLNQFESVLNHISDGCVTMKDVYIIEALMIKHL
jgi:hypothetical protein